MEELAVHMVSILILVTVHLVLRAETVKLVNEIEDLYS
jgi:hypothetical protein